MNNPINSFDPDGKDVIDANDPSYSLSVSEMTQRTKNIIKQMNYNPNGRFSYNVLTTHTNFRRDLYQPMGGRLVTWGNKDGYPRFKSNTMFTLNAKNEKMGYYTVMTATPSIKVNPALSQQHKKNIFNLTFGATTFDAEGNPINADYVVILTGTIEEINQALNGTGLEVYYNEENEKYKLRKTEEEKKDEDENNAGSN